MKAPFKLLCALILFELISCQKIESERMVVFDDYQLHISETGRGQPTVIIEAALGSGLASYDTLQTAISKLTKVLSYDRPGLGKSSRSPNPRTLPVYMIELKLLLKKENIQPPYILVGHSLGGLLIRYYTHQFPDEIVGLVFIDCVHEDWLEYIRTTHSDEEVKMFNKVIDPHQYTGVLKDEWQQFEYNCELIRGIEIPQHIPTRIITATQYGHDQQMLGYHPEDMTEWANMQARMMKNVKDAQQIITDRSGHSIQLTEPELIINAVKELIEIHRNKSK
jgi:pimeloyl-ACP methyl ester carboxylesterase